MTRRPLIGVVKPDHGVAGGFERHLMALVARLRPRYDIEIVSVDARTRPTRLRGLPVTNEMLEHHDEFFALMAQIDRVHALDLARFDAVLTTQPPSYLAEHERKIALFYHHSRQFYDLEEAFIESGFVDPDLHRAAARVVRAAESGAATTVEAWLAGSSEVASRLQRFWAVDENRITLHRAPSTSAPESPLAPYRPGGAVVTVGRHEWPKRTELAVAAAHLHRHATEVIGDGSRLLCAQSLDAEFGAGDADPADPDLWKNPGVFTPGWQQSDHSPSGLVEFVTTADDADRNRHYEQASMVLCPAYREDYGLTALEGMSWGRPVLVCNDGGGLTEFVEHEVNGLVVDPTPEAIAEGVRSILGDPGRAREMGEAARDFASGVTWADAVSSVSHAVDRALGADVTGDSRTPR